MKTPKTVKGYLQMFIDIAKDKSGDLKNVTEDEMRIIGFIRAGIQNELGEPETMKILIKHDLI